MNEIDAPILESEIVLNDIRGLIEDARRQTVVAVNSLLTTLYWRIGKRIHVEVLGSTRGAYGEEIVATVPRQLTAEYGPGYTKQDFRFTLKIYNAIAI